MNTIGRPEVSNDSAGTVLISATNRWLSVPLISPVHVKL
uniref:Plasmid partitioning protein n=1 Tax=Rhizobium meliloti TaxID=382 RepID=I2E2E3_RHIML|nr:plasmid partitioning protein [Sinorhizobium meliloti]